MNSQIVPTEQSYYLAPAAQLNTVLAAYQAKKDFIEKVLVENVDFGPPYEGSKKKVLLKPGAEKLSSFFGLAPTFEDAAAVEDWTGEQHGSEPFFFYRRRCFLHLGERIIGSAEGSCNSWETKYRYRQAARICPNCKQETIIKGKAEYGGGWLCFAKKGGCGAKFKDGDPAIEDQQLGQIKNPDPADQANTVLKMADKRALVAAVLITVGASDYFTQDVDDFVEGEYQQQSNGKPATAQPITMTLGEARNVKTKNAKHEEVELGMLNPEQLKIVAEKSKDARTVQAASMILADWALKEEAQDEAARQAANE